MSKDSVVKGDAKPTDLSTKNDFEIDLDKNPVKFATHQPGVFIEDAHDKHYMELTLRQGNHSDLVKRILRHRIDKRAADFPRWPANSAGGARVMWIESRFWYDRERLSEDFDDDWRKYRAQYLHSLNLDPREPVHVPEFEHSLINPIKRFYQKPGDWFEENVLLKYITKDKPRSQLYRWGISRLMFAYVAAIGIYYYSRYNYLSWEQRRGIDFVPCSPHILPGDPFYPYKDPHTEPAHFRLDRFDKRNIFKDLRDYEDRTVF